jgi:hypothetical protein
MNSALTAYVLLAMRKKLQFAVVKGQYFCCR